MLRNILRNVRHSLILSCGFLVFLAFQRMQQYDIHPHREASLSRQNENHHHHGLSGIRNNFDSRDPFDQYGFMKHYDRYLSKGLSKVFSIGLFRFVWPSLLDQPSPHDGDPSEEDYSPLSSSLGGRGVVYESLRSSFVKRHKKQNPTNDKSTQNFSNEHKNAGISFIVDFKDCSNPSLFDAAAVFQLSLDRHYLYDQKLTTQEQQDPINVPYRLHAVVPSNDDAACLETLQHMGYSTISRKDIPIPKFLHANHPTATCINDDILLDAYAFHSLEVDVVAVVPLPSMLIPSSSDHSIKQKNFFPNTPKTTRLRSKTTPISANTVVRIYEPNNTLSQNILMNHVQGQFCVSATTDDETAIATKEVKENQMMVSLASFTKPKQQEQQFSSLCASSRFSLCCESSCEVAHHQYNKEQTEKDLRLKLVTFPHDCPVPWDCSMYHKTGEGKREDSMKPYCLTLRNQWSELVLENKRHQHERIAPIDDQSNARSSNNTIHSINQKSKRTAFEQDDMWSINDSNSPQIPLTQKYCQRTGNTIALSSSNENNI